MLLVSFCLQQAVFALNEGELVVSLRIGNPHGGVYSYDSREDDQVMGLLLTSEDTDSGLDLNNDGSLDLAYLPAEGFKKITVPSLGTAGAMIDLTLICETDDRCNQFLNLDPEGTKTRVTQTFWMEPGKTTYVDFVVYPKNETMLATKQLTGLALTENTQAANRNKSAVLTLVGQLAYKSNLMLNWALNLQDSGFYNQEINGMYKRVINVINGFLVIALLLIAAAWNFSFLISTKKLKQALIYFTIVSVIVNFTLPLNRLVIDVADAVQGSFLTKSDGEKITAQDLLSMQIDQTWVGEEKHSWTPLGEPYQTTWRLSAGPELNLTNFNLGEATSQDIKEVQLTPKGKTINLQNYLSEIDCQPANRLNCGSNNTDCTKIYLPDICTIGEKVVVATCDKTHPTDSKWVQTTFECIILN